MKTEKIESYHHEFSPSKFPQFEKCIRFDSSEAGEAAERGTLQHTRLEDLLKHTDAETMALNVPKERADWTLENLTKSEVNSVDWAYYKILSLLSEFSAKYSSVQAERKVAAFTSSFGMTEGTADVTFRGSLGELVVVDYKSGLVRDYSGQMKIYCLAAAQELNLSGDASVYAFVVYGREQTVQKHVFKVAELQAYFDEMFERLENRKDAEPTVCDYCSWCSHKLNCKARNALAKEVKKVLPETVESFKITDRTNVSTLDGSKLGKLYEFARAVSDWAEDVEKEVKRRLDAGEVVAGFEFKTSAIRSFPSNAAILENLNDEQRVQLLNDVSISQKTLKDIVGNEDFKTIFEPMLQKTGTKNTISKTKTKTEEVRQ